MYGFEGEVKSKYNPKMAELFTEIFNYLPLCHLINKKVFVCHGGLFKEDGVTLDKIRKVNRNRQPPDEGIMCDLLWFVFLLICKATKFIPLIKTGQIRRNSQVVRLQNEVLASNSDRM